MYIFAFFFLSRHFCELYTVMSMKIYVCLINTKIILINTYYRSNVQLKRPPYPAFEVEIQLSYTHTTELLIRIE